MRDSCYIIVNKSGVQDFRKTSYPLKPGELAVKINLSLPDSIFHKPKVEGTLSISEEDIPKGSIIKELEFELKRLKKRE